MRSFSQVSPRFWTGQTGRKLRRLGQDCQVIAFYLMTCPGSTHTGLYYLPLVTLAHETGIDPPRAERALRQVCTTGFCSYDPESETIFVTEMAKWQNGDSLKPNDKRVTGIQRALEPYLKSPFYAQFWDLYGEPFSLNGDLAPSAIASSKGSQGSDSGFGNPSEGVIWSENNPFEGVNSSSATPSKGLRRGFEGVAESSATPSKLETERDTDTETERDTETEVVEGARKAAPWPATTTASDSVQVLATPQDPELAPEPKPLVPASPLPQEPFGDPLVVQALAEAAKPFTALRGVRMQVAVNAACQAHAGVTGGDLGPIIEAFTFEANEIQGAVDNGETVSAGKIASRIAKRIRVINMATYRGNLNKRQGDAAMAEHDKRKREAARLAKAAQRKRDEEYDAQALPGSEAAEFLRKSLGAIGINLPAEAPK